MSDKLIVGTKVAHRKGLATILGKDPDSDNSFLIEFDEDGEGWCGGQNVNTLLIDDFGQSFECKRPSTRKVYYWVTKSSLRRIES